MIKYEVVWNYEYKCIPGINWVSASITNELKDFVQPTCHTADIEKKQTP